MQYLLAIAVLMLVVHVAIPQMPPTPPGATNFSYSNSTNGFMSDITLVWCQGTNRISRLYSTTNLASGFGTNYLELNQPMCITQEFDACFFKVCTLRTNDCE